MIRKPHIHFLSFFLLITVAIGGCAPNTELTKEDSATGTATLVSLATTTATLESLTTTLTPSRTITPISTKTHWPTITLLSTVTPRPPTITPTPTPYFSPTPIPAWLTPVSTALASEPQNETDALVIQVLRKAISYYGHFPVYSDAGSLFGIEIIPDTLNPDWIRGEGITNKEKSLVVFFSSAPEPTPDPVATMTYDEWFEWQKARKMEIEDLITGEIYWVKWEDYLLHRPIEPIGWIDNEIFVFSQCGNPSLCFVTAINARDRTFLITLTLED